MNRLEINTADAQRGFTLIELLIVCAILAAIMLPLSMTTITIMRVSPLSRDWSVALAQAQNAGYWISRDVQMSQSMNEAPSSPQFLTLTIPEWDEDSGTVVSSEVIYQLDGSGELRSLVRSYNGGQPILISRDIYYDPLGDPDQSTAVISTSDNRTLTFRITAATSDRVKVIKEYKAKQIVPPPYPE
jgi:prepilin-type N-terminal cleavage/methylation domain-containing protein